MKKLLLIVLLCSFSQAYSKTLKPDPAVDLNNYDLYKKNYHYCTEEFEDDTKCYYEKVFKNTQFPFPEITEYSISDSLKSENNLYVTYSLDQIHQMENYCKVNNIKNYYKYKIKNRDISLLISRVSICNQLSDISEKNYFNSVKFLLEMELRKKNHKEKNRFEELLALFKKRGLAFKESELTIYHYK